MAEVIDTLNERIVKLEQKLDILLSEVDIRRVQARYMFLCDTPCPEYAVANDAERIDRIMELYCQDAVWEGVGPYYDGQFGRAKGKPAIRQHFERFWNKDRNPSLIFNVHYLTSEQIHVDGDTADGQWVHCQPWIFSDGTSLLRSSRLNNRFRKEDGIWKISRTRTENVFVAPLKNGWAQNIPAYSVLMQP